MPDREPQPNPLTDQALFRLRKLAEGNGLKPEAIILMGAEEKTYILKGALTLIPFCDLGGGRYAGPPRGKDRKILSDLGALRLQVDTRRQAFLTGRDWLSRVEADLKTEPGEGWGLDGVRIELPESSVIYATSATCPTCHGTRTITCPRCQGQGSVTCAHCHGQKQELCTNCGGRGEDPLHNGQPCPICKGLRYAPCRYCNAMGHLVCPECNGTRGTACGTCKGTGVLSEEVILACGVNTQFRVTGDNLPTGLRRGLDRLGLVNLGKGHADIESVAPPEEERPPNSPQSGAKIPEPEAGQKKREFPVLHYRARLPFSEMRMDFGGKKALIGSFGKRGVLLDVPTFLDASLQPYRGTLAKAARGKASLDEAIKARAVRDALKLVIAGHGQPEALRKVYPAGLSLEAMQEILLNTRRAVGRHTLWVRGCVAILCLMLTAGLYGGLFMMGMQDQLTQEWTRNSVLLLDLAALILPLLLSWLSLTLSTRFVLKRRFREIEIPLTPKTTGMTGFSMLAFILLGWCVGLAIMPIKPLWLTPLLRLVGL